MTQWDSEQQIRVMNVPYLHSRPYAAVQQEAQKFASRIQVSWENRSADAKSISSLMTDLGFVPYGETITVSAHGIDSREAVRTIASFFLQRCGEHVDGVFWNVLESMDERCVVLDLAEQVKRRVIEKLCHLLARRFSMTNGDSIAEKVLERELAFSSGIGDQVAVPHSNWPQFPQSCVAFARMDDPIEWLAVDHRPVSLVFMIFGKNELEKREIVTKLTQYLASESLRNKLLRVTDPAAVTTTILSHEDD